MEEKDSIANLMKEWFIEGVKTMDNLGSLLKGNYYNVGLENKPLSEYDAGEFTSRITESINQNNFNNNDIDIFEVIHKSISWMPGNIMIAPSPRMGDTHSGDDFDNTCKNVIPNDKYDTLKSTFENMKSFLQNTNQTECAVTSLENLKEIVRWDGPYAFHPEQWLLDSESKQWKNNDKNITDSENMIKELIIGAKEIVAPMRGALPIVDHLRFKEYKKLRNEMAMSKLKLLPYIAKLQEYCNFAMYPNIEKYIHEWEKVYQNLEKGLKRVSPKFK